jgi:hypothetical protein
MLWVTGEASQCHCGGIGPGNKLQRRAVRKYSIVLSTSASVTVRGGIVDAMIAPLAGDPDY